MRDFYKRNDTRLSEKLKEQLLESGFLKIQQSDIQKEEVIQKVLQNCKTNEELWLLKDLKGQAKFTLKQLQEEYGSLDL